MVVATDPCRTLGLRIGSGCIDFPGLIVSATISRMDERRSVFRHFGRNSCGC